jgi:hypothetical protein
MELLWLRRPLRTFFRDAEGYLLSGKEDSPGSAEDGEGRSIVPRWMSPPASKRATPSLGIIEEGQEVMKEFKGKPALDCWLVSGRAGRGTLRNRSLWHAQDLGRRAWP